MPAETPTEIPAQPSAEVPAQRPAATWCVYLLECADGSLYCGSTNNLAKRLAAHNGVLPGGARYTRARRPVRMVASRDCAGKADALRLEAAVKRMPRAGKLAFLLGDCSGRTVLASGQPGAEGQGLGRECAACVMQD